MINKETECIGEFCTCSEETLKEQKLALVWGWSKACWQYFMVEGETPEYSPSLGEELRERFWILYGDEEGLSESMGCLSEIGLLS